MVKVANDNSPEYFRECRAVWYLRTDPQSVEWFGRSDGIADAKPCIQIITGLETIAFTVGCGPS